MSITKGIRTWQRRSDDPSLPISERIAETTAPHDMETAIREADFLTIPRTVYNANGSRVQEGYSDRYAQDVEQALRERFDYRGGRRTSRSGRSHVFERHQSEQGAAFALGVAEPAVAVTAGGDGAA